MNSQNKPVREEIPPELLEIHSRKIGLDPGKVKAQLDKNLFGDLRGAPDISDKAVEKMLTELFESGKTPEDFR